MLFHDANTSFRGKMVISRLHLVTSSDYTYNESIRSECFSCKIFRILLGENYRSSNDG